MKIALLSDLHLDRPFAWAGPSAGVRLRLALRSTLKNAVEVAKAEDVDAFFLGGDIYEHELIAPDTAAFLATTLGTLDPVPVLVAPGNHDGAVALSRTGPGGTESRSRLGFRSSKRVR